MLSNSFLVVLVVCVIGGQSSPFDFGKILGDLGRAFSQQSPIENNHRITGDPPIHVKGQWIKSAKLHNNQIYLFAKAATSMTWYEADDYCLEHGAFLAEPVSAEESNFLARLSAQTFKIIVYPVFFSCKVVFFSHCASRT